MKKVIQVIIFIIIFIAILLVDFIVYKNISKIIPTHQNEIYTFENNSKDEKYNFFYEISIQIEETIDYKRVLDYSSKIGADNAISKIIKTYVFKDEFLLEEMEFIIPLYEGSLENTIYGDLKFIMGKTNYKKESYTNFYIVYSEDMKKICYYNFDNSKGLEPNDYSITIKEEIHPNAQSTLYDYDDMENYGEKNSAEAVKNKEELIKSVKKEFSKTNLNIDINPNTILKKTDFYIFQDEENEVTIYYDNDNNVIFGLCIGFEY